jgi:hypothetical protein
MRRKLLADTVWLGISICMAFAATTGLAGAEPGQWYDNIPESSLLIASRPLVDAHADDAEASRSTTPETGVACCPDIAGRLCPCSYLVVEGLILGRDNQSDRDLALDLNTDEELLGSGELDFDWTGGVRALYGTRVCGCLSFELGYLGVYSNSASDGVELADSLMLPGDLGLQVNNFFGADDVDARYSSDLHSFEANSVCCCCGCDSCGHCRSIEWLSGWRYLNFNEDFSISSFDDAEGTTVYAVDADNHLFGGQIGVRYRQCRGRWSWESTGKAGLFVNYMEQSQAPIIDFPAFMFRDGQEGDDTRLAFVGDLNLTGIYQLTRVWGLRFGYNLIWLEGVALAPDQLDFTNAANSGREVRDGGGVLLHGFNVGGEARW